MAIDYSVEAGVGFIVLNRPPANAYDAAMVGELRAAAERAAGDPAVRVVVVKSASPKFFCSGADISTLQGATPAAFAHFLMQAQDAVNAIAAAPKLFIAAIAGHCIGGGLEIALGCDFRFASSGGYKLGLAEVNLGLSPGMGGTQRLARILPKSRALHLMVTGEMLTPEQALADGIVDKVLPADSFEADVFAAAKKLAAGPTMAQGYIKLSVNRGLETSLTEGLAIERAHQSLLFASADAAEGLAAFLGKRPAAFTGA
jgi:enoyl-CoA hydratase/carnithine racemase